MSIIPVKQRTLRKKQQTQNNSTTVGIEQNTAETVKYVSEDYKSTRNWRTVPMSARALEENFIPEMLDWANNNSIYFADDFLDAKGVPPKTWDMWKDKYEFVRNADELVKRKVAKDRERGGMTKELDGNFLAKFQGMYCPKYRKFCEDQIAFKASLDAKYLDKGETNVTVVIRSIPDTGIPNVTDNNIIDGTIQRQIDEI